MATVTINDNPVETDTIVFDLLTPDADGCFVTNPYKVDSVIIYYVERNFSSHNTSQYNVINYQSTKLAAAQEAEKIACSNPTTDNIAEAKRLRDEANSESTSTPFYYNEARPVKVIGNSEFPAWLSSDEDNSLIDHVTEDNDGNTLYGNFQYSWDTTGMREGDYFICWTWTPLPAGDRLSEHIKFNLGGNTVVTTSIPSHYTNPDKYTTLLERYLPEMFKLKMVSDDRSPDVVDKFNQAIAAGFTNLEDLTNQLVDLLDANNTHELYLPLLANLFGLKLKTNDPTLWRRQIKNAIPLFKKKGTKAGLKEALAQAGITMTKLTKLWQVISSYTWTEAFVYDGTTSSWELSRVALDVDLDNFSLELRGVGEDDYISLSSDYVEFTTADGVTTMRWIGDTLSVEAIELVAGDIVKILYKYNVVPGSTEQTIENYIRNLPLADQRDETDQDYPLKNWNVRVIEEDDPLLNLIIPERHPFHENLVYGKIRTEFPYSENAYNKDEYNGSIRNSKVPCDIDKDFLDPCSSCLGSKFNIDLEIENLSDDRIEEAKDVILEFSPFNAILHTMNFTGAISEFLQPAVEEISILVNVQGEEFVISGDGQMWFNRAMKKGTTTSKVIRTDLADSEVVVTDTGTAYNDAITIFSPDVQFSRIGMNEGALLEILAPSANAGTTTLTSPNKNIAVVASATEPLNTAAFTFRVANILETNNTTCEVTQDNFYIFSDEENNYSLFDVKSSWDVDHSSASGAWTITIDGTAYTISNILPGGSLILENDGTLPTTTATNVDYILKNYSGTTIHTAETGKLTVKKRGRITVDSSLADVRNLIRGTCYLVITGDQYKVNGFVDGVDDEFYIEDYDDGDMSGVDLVIYQRIVDNAIGYLSHQGLRLRVSGDLETTLNIQNGHRNLVAEDDRVENDCFKENFLVTIDGEDYFIVDIDGDSPSGYTTILLNGLDSYWSTFAAGGTSVDFTITKYTKKEITIPGQQFDLDAATFRTYDRAGREVITVDTEETPEEVSMLSIPESNASDYVRQKESVAFKIEWADGSVEQGEI
jgi:hypothetical protein